MRITLRIAATVVVVLSLIARFALGSGGQHASAARVAIANTATDTPTSTSTSTGTATASSTASATGTATTTGTATATSSATGTATTTATGTASTSVTPTTPSATASPTVAATGTGTPPTSTPTPSGAGSTAYFAEGYTGTAAVNGRAAFAESLNVLNPNSGPAVITITYYIQGASAPLVVTKTIGAHTTLRESVNTDVGPDKFAAAVISSPQRVFATRTILRTDVSGARLDGSTTLPVKAPAANWGFPEGYTGVTFQQYLTVLNPGSVTANVTILLAPQAASSAGAKTLTLTVPPTSRTTANIRALNLDGPAKSVAMVISSDQPIVPERVIYFGDGAGSGKFGSTVSSGITTPSTQLRIAYASSGGTAPAGSGTTAAGNQEFITLLNPSTVGNPVQVTATFFGANGSSIGQAASVTVAPGTRQTILTNIPLGAAAVSQFSVVLNATGPIEAESAQYFNGSPNVGKHPGVAFPALSASYTDVFFSDLSTQLADSTAVDRTVYLYNPGTVSIGVSATYYGSTSSTAIASYSVPAGGIASVDVDTDTSANIPPGPVGAEFKLTSGSAGTFIAYATGRTADGLLAIEDVGLSAS